MLAEDAAEREHKGRMRNGREESLMEGVDFVRKQSEEIRQPGL